MANQAGVTNSYITRLRKAKANPTLDVVDRVAAALEVRLELRLVGQGATEDELVQLSRQCSPAVLAAAMEIMRQSASLNK